MIPNDQPLREQTIKRMIDSIIKNHSQGAIELSDWEENFMYSISEQFNKKGDLSLKQSEILERIYDK